MSNIFFFERMVYDVEMFHLYYHMKELL